VDSTEIAELIKELEDRVERLRALYDQYFMGIERLEPLTLRKDLDRRLWVLRREQIRNTGLRFKLETTIQRYNTYQQYWQRIVREIENGTYQRDLGRAAQRFGENAVTAFAKRRQKMFEKGMAKKAERDAHRQGQSSPPPAGSPDPPANESYDVTFDDSEFGEQPPLSLDMDFGSAPKPTVAPAVSAPRAQGPLPAPRLPPVSAPSPRSPGLPPARLPLPSRPDVPSADRPDEDLSATRLRKIYGDYVEAKRKANESTAALTYNKIAASLQETAKQLRAKHQGQKVDFEIVLKNGKPVLKPVMKG